MIKTTKELRKLIRETDIKDLEKLWHELDKKYIRVLVRRRGHYIYIDDLTVFDDGWIRCTESPNWSTTYKQKRQFSYNVKLEIEACGKRFGKNICGESLIFGVKIYHCQKCLSPNSSTKASDKSPKENQNG